MLDYEPLDDEAYEALRTSARASQASAEPSPMVGQRGKRGTMLDYEPVSDEAFEALRTSARASQASVEPSPMVPSPATRTILTVFKAAESVFLIYFSLANKLKR